MMLSPVRKYKITPDVRDDQTFEICAVVGRTDIDDL